jgi:hypothetical protein
MTEQETKKVLAALPTKFVDILPEDAEPWEKEKARHMDAVQARFRNRGPLAGGTLEQYMESEFKPLRDPDWRCPSCTFGVSVDGQEDVRTKWCTDCVEERRMYADEDREWMCGEVESVSEITGEWAEVRERGYKGDWKT